jgi:hypothetical protein
VRVRFDDARIDSARNWSKGLCDRADSCAYTDGRGVLMAMIQIPRARRTSARRRRPRPRGSLRESQQARRVRGAGWDDCLRTRASAEGRWRLPMRNPSPDGGRRSSPPSLQLATWNRKPSRAQMIEVTRALLRPSERAIDHPAIAGEGASVAADFTAMRRLGGSRANAMGRDRGVGA